jgi:hypothetical protein
MTMQNAVPCCGSWWQEEGEGEGDKKKRHFVGCNYSKGAVDAHTVGSF